MTMYTRPDKKRLNLNAERVYEFGGVTAIWRTFASAVSGVPEAGIGDTFYYAQRVITGHFGYQFIPRFMENVAAPGLIAAGTVQMTTRERIGRQDEVIYNSAFYRVESDPVPTTMAGWWITQIKRASE